MSRPTLVTVARLAGVSVASVSRVLNGGRATEDMTLRVREAVEQLGYVPDAAARSLRAGRTSQLAFAVPDVGNPTYVSMMRGIESVTRAAGYRLLVHSTDSDPADEVGLIESLDHRYVDGLIIASIRNSHDLLRALARSRHPIVMLSNMPEGAVVDSVPVDSGAGLRLATDHLLATGRRALAMVNGPADTFPGGQRLAAFQAALDGAGLARDPATVVCAADFTYAAGLIAARELLSRCRPDAVMCANDLLAIAVIRALAEAGLRVPGEVAVAGIDDTELARMHLPSLTSVSLASARRGAMAAALMLDRLADTGGPPRREEVAPELVIRESTQPAGLRAEPAALA